MKRFEANHSFAKKETPQEEYFSWNSIEERKRSLAAILRKRHIERDATHIHHRRKKEEPTSPAAPGIPYPCCMSRDVHRLLHWTRWNTCCYTFSAVFADASTPSLRRFFLFRRPMVPLHRRASSTERPHRCCCPNQSAAQTLEEK